LRAALVVTRAYKPLLHPRLAAALPNLRASDEIL